MLAKNRNSLKNENHLLRKGDLLERTAKQLGKVSVMMVLMAGMTLASLDGAFINSNRDYLTPMDLAYRVTSDAHVPDDIPVVPHYTAFDTKHLRNVRYDDGKDRGLDGNDGLDNSIARRVGYL